MIGEFSLGQPTQLRFEIDGVVNAEGWVGLNVHCRTDAFRGSVRITLLMDELTDLLGGLKQCADAFPSSYAWKNIEQDLDINIEMHGSGTGTIEATITTGDARLSMRIGTDQSELRIAYQDLKRHLSGIANSGQ